jgi:hypothetical protein
MPLGEAAKGDELADERKGNGVVDEIVATDIVWQKRQGQSAVNRAVR